MTWRRALFAATVTTLATRPPKLTATNPQLAYHNQDEDNAEQQRDDLCGGSHLPDVGDVVPLDRDLDGGDDDGGDDKVEAGLYFSQNDEPEVAMRCC